MAAKRSTFSGPQSDLQEALARHVTSADWLAAIPAVEGQKRKQARLIKLACLVRTMRVLQDNLSFTSKIMKATLAAIAAESSWGCSLADSKVWADNCHKVVAKSFRSISAAIHAHKPPSWVKVLLRRGQFPTSFFPKGAEENKNSQHKIQKVTKCWAI